MRNGWDFGSQAAEIAAWHAETMPLETADLVLLHLEDEVDELMDARSFLEEMEEAADVFIALICYTARRGIAPSTLLEQVHKAMQRNRRRKWKLMPNGTYHHAH